MKFEDLDAWQIARRLARDTYFLTRTETLSKDFRLCSQIQAAAVSVMSNIAEGFERTGKGEKLHLYNIARGSCAEVRSQSYLIEDILPALIGDAARVRELSITAGRLISGLMNSTRRSPGDD